MSIFSYQKGIAPEAPKEFVIHVHIKNNEAGIRKQGTVHWTNAGLMRNYLKATGIINFSNFSNYINKSITLSIISE